MRKRHFVKKNSKLSRSNKSNLTIDKQQRFHHKFRVKVSILIERTAILNKWIYYSILLKHKFN